MLSASLVLAGGPGAAFAEPGDDSSVPSEAEVAAAQDDAAAKERDVSAVQADLVKASIALDEAGITAAQAAEAYNGALWQAQEARKSARAAEAAARAADRELEERRELYARTLVADYEGGAQVQGLTALVTSDGIEALLDRTVTMGNTSEALDSQYDAFSAATAIAEVAVTRADDALDRAEEAEQQAVAARDAAAAAEATASAEADAIADTRTQLIAELAELQGISVALAAERQTALEQAAAEAAAAAAAKQAEEAARQAEQEREAAEKAAQEAAEKARREEERKRRQQEKEQQSTATPTPTATATPTATPTASPTSPATTTPAPTTPTTPTPTTPVPPPVTTPPPPASSGAAAAIAFARSQIGKPYKYGASGPGSWDCSGLTSAAWAAGGKSLPHYSVAQYTQSTAISSSDLQPGDLVFWGSSSKSSSIYHVALYVGGGQIIHAPRTGRNVSEESMYAWRAPDFFARP